MTSSLSAGRHGEDYTKALFLLENKMFDFIQKAESAPDSGEQGYFQEPYGKYRYVFGLKKKDGNGTSHLNKADLRVEWKSGKRQNSIDLQTYFLGPSDEATTLE